MCARVRGKGALLVCLRLSTGNLPSDRPHNRPSAYVGKVLFLFYGDGRVSAARIVSYTAATRSAEVIFTFLACLPSHHRRP